MASGIGRRHFMSVLGGTAIAWPLAARAQQPAMPAVGFMHTLSVESTRHLVAAFRQGLKEAGFIEGQNVAVEYRWAQGQYDRLPELAADLVGREVAVIAATGGEPSPTIPIVFTASGDPVREGLVASLNKPGGNVTGITIFGPDAVTKRVQLLHQLLPQAATIASLVNPTNPIEEIETGAAQTAATSFGLQMLVLRASKEGELETAFAAMAQQRIGALLVGSDPFFVGLRDQIVSLAARQGMPAIYFVREFAQAGGLMTYGNSLTDVYRQVGIYVGRILKGEKPADLPVMQASKFEFVINLKTAKALGLTVPNSLLVTADEVIE